MSAEIRKTFSVALDVKRPVSNRDFEVVEGDTGNTLSVALSDGGAPVDLTDCRVVAVFSNSAGTASQDNQRADGGITVTGADSNVAEIALFPSSIAPGSVECELQVYSGTNQDVLVTSAKFNFRCRRSMLNASTIEATGEHPLLVALIAEVNEAVTKTKHDADDIISGILPVARGGTGAATAAGARTALGITPAGIGAAADGHTHTPADIGAAASTHTHAPADIGAAASVHTHAPADIGAATAANPALTGTIALAGVIVLSAESYGTTLPPAGTEGRLFFKRVT